MQELLKNPFFEDEEQIIKLLHRRFLFLTKELERTSDVLTIISHESLNDCLKEQSKIPKFLDQSTELKKIPNEITDFMKLREKIPHKTYWLEAKNWKTESEIANDKIFKESS